MSFVIISLINKRYTLRNSCFFNKRVLFNFVQSLYVRNVEGLHLSALMA